MGFAFPPDKEPEKQDNGIEEFEELCRPLVEYLQKRYHPHAWIIIEWDRATLAQDKYGVPFQVPD